MTAPRHLTQNGGQPISDNQNSQTAGQRGPILLQDFQLIEKLAHFDRERIPERVVHARGAGAHGVFQAYGNVSEYTKAKFLQEQGKETPVFLRFSMVIHPSGSPESLRDPRGFATKFYTEEGNYDLVGNDLPVFFIRDTIKFPDMVHALKPAPQTNIQDPERYWDFFTLSPESTHMLVWLFSDRGRPANYRQMAGFGVHTFKWVNDAGKESFVKYHWLPKQGIVCLTDDESHKIGGMDTQFATRDLHHAIEMGNFPEWELNVQIMDPAEELELDFDPLDATKTWPEDRFPLKAIGRMTLNRNVENYFAEVEQAAFSPGMLVPGVEATNDKLLQGRLFSYADTQRYRLGANYLQIPVNCPYAPVQNNTRDGFMATKAPPGNTNYEPSSMPDALTEAPPNPPSTPAIAGNVVRLKISNTNDFQQAGELFRSFTPDHQQRLIDNIVRDMETVRPEIRARAVCNFARADAQLGMALAQKLGVEVPAAR
jgi:catalase